MKLNYENLLREAAEDGLYVIENADFQSGAAGLINGDVIGINKKIRSTTERTCILAEELGHHYTTVGNIIDLSDPKPQAGISCAALVLQQIDRFVRNHRNIQSRLQDHT